MSNRPDGVVRNRDMIDCPKCGAPKGDACRTPACEALKPYQAQEPSVAVVKPFTPDEARAQKKHVIPDEVVQVVNEMLVRELSNNRATLFQDDIMAEVLKRMPHLTSNDVFKNKYLDFEPLFEAQGWEVKYDSPAYCETYRAHFIFTAKRGQR